VRTRFSAAGQASLPALNKAPPPPTSPALASRFHMCCSRFILNLPSSELSSIPRIIFQVEQAYWYYSDHVQPSHPTTLPTCTLKTFSSLLFQVCPLLEKWEPEHEKVFVEFMKYKSRVPVCGAILVAEGWDKVLMVRGWKGSTWGWPKGKINQNEAKHVCAAREVRPAALPASLTSASTGPAG